MTHIGAGVSYLQKLDLRMNAEHPPLPKVLSALPLVLRGVRAETMQAPEKESRAKPAMATSGCDAPCPKPLGPSPARSIVTSPPSSDAWLLGAKRAVIAVAHTILIIAFHILKCGQGYHELGGNYLEQINKDQLQRYFVKRLQRLGLKVTLESATAVA